MSLSKIVFLLCLVFLGGCAGMKKQGAFEFFGPSKSAPGPLYILDNVHSLNIPMETTIAADLRQAFSARGFQIAANPSEAKWVVVPTLGRVLEPGSSDAQNESGGISDARKRSLIRSPSQLGMTQAQQRGFSHSSSALFANSAEWRVGLLLTAYDRAAHSEFDPASKNLLPVWRVFAYSTVSQPSWKAVSKPLIEAAANGAAENLR